MPAVDTRSAAGAGARLATARRRHPQWWAAALAGGAWTWLLLHHHGLGHGPTAAGSTGPPAEMGPPGVGPPGLGAALGAWTVMAVAMMLPPTLPAVRHVAVNSIRCRRQRAMAVYLLGYLAVWVGFGALTTVTARTAGALPAGGDSGRERLLTVGALLLAAGWQLTRTKRRALNTCRRTVPLPPQGHRADRACLHFGLQQALRCVRSCWALMLPLVGRHGPLLMLGVSVLVLAEETTRAGRRLRAPSALAMVLLAAGTALVGQPT